MVDTIVWLVDDSNLVSQIITKQQLGPNPPITLDTNGLAILLPGLRKYPNKGKLHYMYRRLDQNKHIFLIFISIHSKWPSPVLIEYRGRFHNKRHIKA